MRDGMDWRWESLEELYKSERTQGIVHLLQTLYWQMTFSQVWVCPLGASHIINNASPAGQSH